MRTKRILSLVLMLLLGSMVLNRPASAEERVILTTLCLEYRKR